MLKPKPSETMERVENQNRLIIAIKPPTLVYSGKPKPSKTTTEEEANQLQPSECETKPPTETKPEPNHENTQELSWNKQRTKID